MAFFGRPNEIIIRIVHMHGQIAEVLRYLVGKGLRVNTLGRGRLVDFLTMFVRARQEHHVIPVQALEACQNVTGKRRIGMANMGLVIDVIDRGRDVIGLFVPGHGRKSFAQVVKQNGPKWAVMVKISVTGQ